MKILITGGLGFIGSAVCRRLIQTTDHQVLVYDAHTYAAQKEALEEGSRSDRLEIVKGDIRDLDDVRGALLRFQPDLVMHLAAESHVDRSIEAPGDFITTNVLGTFTVLQAVRAYYEVLETNRKAEFRFHHISTDEVYGSLRLGDPAFSETNRYDPRSPYSASKAASDHLVSAWQHTFGLPTLTTNCSNNYGPWQYPEKLIPLMISKGIRGEPMPVYGQGLNRRDWLHVDDHAEALMLVASKGIVGGTYNIGGEAEYTNLDVVNAICSVLDKRFPDRAPHDRLITFVEDRPGHDFRYAIDASRLQRELGWRPSRKFHEGLLSTVDWYLDHPEHLKHQDAIKRRGKLS
ncbi:MAG: dTDP-glucose 4,6-dehydratase [Pseudomonadota bacterium]